MSLPCNQIGSPTNTCIQQHGGFYVAIISITLAITPSIPRTRTRTRTTTKVSRSAVLIFGIYQCK